MPLFSVIIPLYNKQDHIYDTITSVLNQEESEYELIIVNDGSTDNSETIVLSFSDPRIKYISQENKGVSSARNLGIQHASGQFLAFIDADDYWFPNHLTEFRKSMNAYPKQHIFCNNYNIQLSKKLVKNTSFSNLHTDTGITLLENLFKNNLLDPIACSSAICIERSILGKRYYFDTSIISGQDTELWIRLGLVYNFVFNPQITATYIKDVSNSLSKSNQLASRKIITERFIEDEKKDPYLKKYIDLNRFSVAIGYKMIRDDTTFAALKSAIHLENLHPKQQFLLNCHPIILHIFFWVKNKLQQTGFLVSVFK